MAKITFHGKSLVVTAGITKEVLERVAELKPKALKLVEKVDDKETILFRYELNPKGASMGRTAVSFDGTETNKDGYLTLTKIENTADSKNMLEWFYKNYGTGFGLADTLEAQIQDAYATIEQEIAALDATIQVID